MYTTLPYSLVKTESSGLQVIGFHLKCRIQLCVRLFKIIFIEGKKGRASKKKKKKISEYFDCRLYNNKIISAIPFFFFGEIYKYGMGFIIYWNAAGVEEVGSVYFPSRRYFTLFPTSKNKSNVKKMWEEENGNEYIQQIYLNNNNKKKRVAETREKEEG